MKTKIKLYAIFQFIALLSLLLGFIGGLIFLYNLANRDNAKPDSWAEQFSFLWNFYYHETVSVFGSFLIYCAVVLWVINIVVGIFIVKIKEKNYYDYLFAMFFIFPIFSSIFCFLAQLSLKSKTVSPTSVSQTQLTNIANKIEKKLISKKIVVEIPKEDKSSIQNKNSTKKLAIKKNNNSVTNKKKVK